jgi:hypothetical protein
VTIVDGAAWAGEGAAHEATLDSTQTIPKTGGVHRMVF